MPERQRVKEERASRVQLRRGCPVAESTQEHHIQLEASHGNSEIDRVSPAPEMVTRLLRSMKNCIPRESKGNNQGDVSWRTEKTKTKLENFESLFKSLRGCWIKF